MDVGAWRESAKVEEREERRIDKNANVRCGPKGSEKDEVPAGLAGAFLVSWQSREGDGGIPLHLKRTRHGFYIENTNTHN